MNVIQFIGTSTRFGLKVLMIFVSILFVASYFVFTSATVEAQTSTITETRTFTACGQAGRNGPSQGQCDTAYSGTSLEGDVSAVNGIQQWTVPATSTYRISAYGAQGGEDTSGVNAGGLGAEIVGDFTLNTGDVLNILVGQAGEKPTTGSRGGGGGGGSFVWNDSDDTLYLAAGGGGGGNYTLIGNAHANSTANGNDGTRNGYGAGGTGGAGGAGGTYPAGGAGWLSNGTGGINAAMNPLRPLAGGTGGESYSAGDGNGGFGGGGGAYAGAAGGGGYSGGGGGGWSSSGEGGGGGSYNSGTNQASSTQANSGDGYIVITRDIILDLADFDLPTVASTTASGYETSMGADATVTYSGGTNGDGYTAPVTRRGFVYFEGTNSTIEIGDPGVEVVEEAGDFAAGTYSLVIEGVSTSTTYTVRSFAENLVGISYGEAVTGEYLEAGYQNYTFTPCSQTGSIGPSQGQCDTAYTGTDLAGDVTVTGGIQSWTVPVTDVYRIQAVGAQGGHNDTGSPVGGRGALASGDFTLNAGTIINILVGQQGLQGSTYAGGGGGGSFVWNDSDDTLYLAAGGGGGMGDDHRSLAAHANTSTNGNAGYGGGAGGTNGTGGGQDEGGGGAGWLSDGNDDQANSGGHTPLTGGVGGAGVTYGADGGFGGGGGRISGGGGGYSGGGGDDSADNGGGGGSFNAGANQFNAVQAQTGSGEVTVSIPSPLFTVSDFVLPIVCPPPLPMLVICLLAPPLSLRQ